MGPSSLGEAPTLEDRRTLLGVARTALAHGVDTGAMLSVDVARYPARLQRERGCFVTLRGGDDALRGCVGSLRPRRPLVAEVARSAFMAGFRDPPLGPLTAEELPSHHVYITVVSTPEPLVVGSEAELLRRLRPHIDGVILREGAQLSTFLPDVWATLPEPEDFVRHLKVKGGWDAEYWSDTMCVELYQTVSFD